MALALQFMPAHNSHHRCHALCVCSLLVADSSRLQKYGRFTEAETGRYISDLVGAFQELERKNIIHRDIKPSVKQSQLAQTTGDDTAGGRMVVIRARG